MAAILYPNFAGIVSVEGTALTTVPAGSAQFGTLRIPKDSPPYFMLHHQRGVGNGFLEISASVYDATYGTSPLSEGDIVVFSPEEGIEWARLRVQSITRKRLSWVYDLVGESFALFGRPGTCEDDYDGYVLNDYFRQGDGGPPYAINVNVWDDASNKTPGQIVSWILNNSLQDYGGTPFSADWFGSRRVNENNPFSPTSTITSFLWRIDENQTCADAFQDLAVIAQHNTMTPWVWGVGNGRWGGLSAGSNGEGRAFFFAPRPSTSMLTFSRSGTQPIAATLRNETTGALADAHILNWPEHKTAEFFNAIEVTYGTGRRVIERNLNAIALQGGFIRLARETVPTIRTEGIARLYGQAFLKSHSDLVISLDPLVMIPITPVYDALQIIPPGPEYLPVPWGGVASMYDNGTTRTVTIRDVKVTFGAQPLLEITIGDTE